MKFYRIFVLAIIILISGCTATYKIYQANKLYLNSDYQRAIEKYDEFLAQEENSAYRTQAELERSDCYYQLGFMEYEKGNWELASQYLYLANSPIADSILDVCYKNLAEIALENADTLKAMQYYSYIADYLQTSKLYNEVLAKKIQLNIDLKDFESAFADYEVLWERAPQSQERSNIQSKIDAIVPFLLRKAEDLKSQKKYQQAVNMLLQYTKYPLKQKDKITDDICNLYLTLANQRIAQRDYQAARRFLDKTLNTCSDKFTEVNSIISDVCEDFLSEGDALQGSLNFDEAISRYQLCFVLRDDYPVASQKIEQARNNKTRYLKALEYEKIGDQYEEEKKYQAALTSYQQALSQFSSAQIKNKIFRMQNLIEAEKDPKGFALRIVKNLDNGKIVNHLEILKQNMKAKYGQYAQFSEWKVTYAIGSYKYEVRYDVISPDETFYFAWRVDLLTQKVTPSNRISEKLMASGDLMKHQKQE